MLVLVAGDQLANRSRLLVGHPGPLVDPGHERPHDLGPQVRFLQQTDCQLLGQVHPGGDGLDEPLVELDPEVLLGVGRGLLLDLRVGHHVGADGLDVQQVGIREIGPEPLVQPLHQLGQGLVEVLVPAGPALAEGPNHAAAAVQADVVLARLGHPEVGHADLHVHGAGRLRRQHRLEVTAVRVPLLHVDVGHRKNLGDERVARHEPLEPGPELLLLPLVEVHEPLLGHVERRVELRLGPISEKRPGEGLHLAGSDHAEAVELPPGVVQLVRVGGDGHRGVVVRGEGPLDAFHLVHEVEDERVVLVGVDAVEAGQRLDGVHPVEPLVHEHRVEEGLVEAGLELLRHHQDPVLVRGEPLGRLGLGEP
ncbi:MAG TPA: hypothetical protein VHL78_10465, partial [Actinomycetota bacterium]|nr:hypothetical protein [Actinomycetota bacterium]